jgi:hypothetical protein
MTRIPPENRAHVSAALIVPMAYALAVSLMTWPAPLHLSQRLIGNNIDNWIFYWNNWWLERAITERHGWFFTPYLFYPQGASLVAHSNSHMNSILALALKPLAGPVFAYNMTLLLGLWLSAVGMFLLVYSLTRHRLAAFVAGFIFAFAPYHLTQALAHAHLGSIQWWPFYAFFLRRALHEYRIRDAVGAGLFAALTLWTGQHLALLLAAWTLAYAGWWLITSRHTWLRTIGILGTTALSALLLSLPIVIPAVENWNEIAHAPTRLVEQTTRQTDLLAYLIPPTHNTLIGSHLVPFYERFIANRAFMPYPGFAVLALALTALVKQTKKALFWGLSGGLWVLLAAGSALRFNGNLYPHVLLPYRFVGHIFPISILRAPDRFNLLLVFSLSTLAGLGAAWIHRHRRRWLLPLVSLILLEYLCIPLPMWDLPPSSPFFEQMTHEETDYCVVDYPMGYKPAKLWLYYQTLHGKPTVEGHVSRYTAADYAFIYSQPLLRALYQAEDLPPYLPPDDGTGIPLEMDTYVQALGPALRALESSGVRYVLLHKPYLDAALGTHLQRVLPTVPVYEDQTLAAYDIARPLPVTYDGFPVPLTPDVALVRFDVQHTDGNPEWQFQLLPIALASRIPPLACQIQLTGDNGSVLASPITLFEAPPERGGDWEAGDVEVQEITTPLPQELEPGAYRWTVHCLGETAYTAPETLQVHNDGHVTYLRHTGYVRYGDAIELEGYRWRTVGTDLQMVLRWEALAKPSADYKVFVHLLNADGEIARQYDAVPCNWRCPTSQWQAGEIISDRTIIHLWGLPPGEYRLAVGLYAAQTQNRLAARGPEGERYPGDYLILPDTFLISPEPTVE